MKLLIVQLRQLGDVLLSSVLCQRAKEAGAEVSFLTTPAGKAVVEKNPFVKQLLTVDGGVSGEIKALLRVRKEKFDAVIDAQRTGRSMRLTFLSGARERVAFRKSRGNWPYNRLVEWENRGYTAWERLKLLEGVGIETPNFRDYLPKFYNWGENPFSGKRYSVVVPTARKEHKMWPLDRFARLIEFLKGFGEVVVLFGPGEEKQVERLKSLCKAPFLSPKEALPISVSASIIREARLFVGNNSFASHLAVAAGTPTLTFEKKPSGWFPPLEWVRELYGKGEFPTVEEAKGAAEQLLKLT